MSNEWMKIEVYRGLKLTNLQKVRYRYLISSTNAVYLIRMMQKTNEIRFIGKILSEYYRNKLIKKYGIFIGNETKIGIGLKLPHPNGIIIGEKVKIGNNCTIYQQVTIGSSKIGDYLNGLQPQLGNNVILFAGSKIIGNIEIKNKTIIGANAVVNKNTEENSVYVGIPAKNIRTKIMN